MMYLAFNTENAKEGRQRFGTNSNVESKTTHSVAFAKLTDEQKARVEFRWNALTVKNAMGPKGTYRMAGIVCSVINDFCVSTDSDFDPELHGQSARDRLGAQDDAIVLRSEEHTSELKSLMRISYAV